MDRPVGIASLTWSTHWDRCIPLSEHGIQCEADVIILENVPDLFANKHWAHYNAAKTLLEQSGYSISSALLGMADFGVPQERFRAVVIASRTRNIPLPSGTVSGGKFKTVRDAISHLPVLKSGDRCSIDPMHITSKHQKSTIAISEQIPLDGGVRPQGVGPDTGFARCDKHGVADKIHTCPAHVGESPQVWSHEKRQRSTACSGG